ncbi:hypothetical protein AWB74_08215 [Caballeronia arvi]|uniref:Uncharacterized protein n=1 Tax=Caballeronia arvi TaxID=1777135 RepID=A0A158L3S9_9BURK|nr:hypothetical protein AWB74_08215 [Caballeronia arvi]
MAERSPSAVPKKLTPETGRSPEKLTLERRYTTKDWVGVKTWRTYRPW